MRKHHRVLMVGLLLELSACAKPIGPDIAAVPAPTYQVQVLVKPFITYFNLGYETAVERGLVDRANFRQMTAWRRRLFVSPRLQRLAREQSVRMAARDEATLTADDLKTMKDVVSPSSLPPRDWWVFVNKVTPSAGADAANAIVMEGTKPWYNDRFYNLKSNFNSLGVGVYKQGDSYFATAIIVEHEAR